MFELYGSWYEYAVDGDHLTIRFKESQWSVGLHWLSVIRRPFSPVEAEALFWELNRQPKTPQAEVYGNLQLKHVKLYCRDELGRLEVELNEVGIYPSADPLAASYELCLPKQPAPELLDLAELPRIIVTHDFHGTKISPLIYPPLAYEDYTARNTWIKSFCFTNYVYQAPSKLELAWIAQMLRKQLIDFVLEKAGYQYTPETCHLLEFPV